MSETEAYHQFMSGLKPWVKQQLKRCHAMDLTMATFVAESLVEYKSSSMTKFDSHLKHKANGGGERGRFNRSNGGKPLAAASRTQIESSG